MAIFGLLRDTHGELESALFGFDLTIFKMAEPTTAEKFLEHYEKYQNAKSNNNAHWMKQCAMWAIGELHKLVGENYKDENECAKAVASSFALIGMTHEEGLETYQELYENSRPT
jgi:hypothetical protein